ncbi:MAG TPA: chromosomal replication initiator protein DnaA, partial [Deltaproteobacteria bacterium]|nr:chromosomal replication initiator protein DnaA [Deltaproteobacteria bacterium]
LFFYSDIGLGKSHIAHAIGNRVLSLRPTAPVRYITARDFAHDYVHSVRNDCMRSFRNTYRSSSIDVFFIDDVHLFKNKEKTQVELCHVLDDLVAAGKQVIMSGFRPPSSIPQIERGLRSRLSAGLVIDIKRPDKDTRSRIVRRKAQKNNFEIPDDVVDLISESVQTNIRDLESAVMTITAMSSLLKRPVSIDLAREMLEGTVAKQRSITIPYILEFISRTFTVPQDVLVSSSRKKEVVYPRQVAIYLCRRYTNEPLANIGQAFSRRHSSVIHSLETIENRYNNDLKVRRDIDFLIDKIESDFA